jgi:hypothetical protein
VYSAQAPGSTWQGHQARTPRRGLHFRHKIHGVQNGLAGLQSHTNLGRSHIWGAQLGWQGCSHTKILQDLGIKIVSMFFPIWVFKHFCIAFW